MMDEQKVFCSNCGSEVDINADFCLKCGKKINGNNNNKKKKLPTWAIVLIIVGGIVLVLTIFIIIALVGYNIYNKTHIDRINDPYKHHYDYYDDRYDDDYYMPKSGTIGDTLIYDDFEVTLESSHIYDYLPDELINPEPEDGYVYLVLFFDVTHNDDDFDIFNSFYMNGYADDTTVDMVNLYNDINGLDPISGTFQAWENRKGYVAFEVSEDFNTFDFTYGEKYDDDTITFSLTSNDFSNVIS